MLGKFSTGSHKFLPGAPLSLVHYKNKIVLWTVTEKNQLIDFRNYNGDVWSEANVCTQTCKASSVAGVQWGDGSGFRIYYQLARDGDLVEGQTKESGGFFVGGGRQWVG
ncbi:hypothetical protein K440DRAFT_635002 [Wilcoxina mikolae CBS 423.85]|nr:hypothetical protein K440DRAFT_635002 [Wilcoxina mikolae CBS 423.85]